MSAPTIKQKLRDKGLLLLARREHSYQEMQRKLRYAATQYAAGSTEEIEIESSDHDEDIDAILEDFKKRGWLSEERFAEQVVHARQGKFGSMRIAHELREKGVNEAVVDTVMGEVKDGEYDNAVAICQRKYGAPPKDRNEWAKQARFLQSRGFGFDIIKRVLNRSDDAE